MRATKGDRVKFILIAIFVLMGVGYAYLTTNLNINGIANIKKATWDIHFENIQVKSGSVTPDIAPTINVNGDSISYEITLNNPGEFYEFTVDVKNAGTLDGMIEAVNSTIDGQPISNLPNYLEYYIKYSDGVEIAPNHLLTAGDKETYVVHIGYKIDLEPGDLPNIQQTHNFRTEIPHKQPTPDAVLKPEPTPVIVYAANIYPQVINIGQEIPNGITTYDNYNDAIASFTGPYFFKYVTINNVVKEAYLGFIYRDNVHYLRGGGATYNSDTELYNDDSPYYESNKSVLQNAFNIRASSTSCEDRSNAYSCQDTSINLLIDVYANGYVGTWPYSGDRCTIWDDGRAYCSIFGQ